MQINISEKIHLSDIEISEAKEIIKSATMFDEMAPLSEHVLIHLNYGGDSADEHILARTSDGKLVGYLHLDQTDEVAGPVVEVVVDPQFRGQQIGTQLVQAAMKKVHDARLRLWAHGELNSAYALAKKLGFSKSRELWQMRRSLHAELPKLELPTGTTIRSFKVGTDEKAWLELNAQVFAQHPEQGRLTDEDLAIRMNEHWFNPAGFLVSENDRGELTGFHWTKVHGTSQSDLKHGHPNIGEIYVLGVAPNMRSTGLGKALAIAGLEYLRSASLAAAMLYVDRQNESAIKLYESIGFGHWDTDVMFQA